jgi:hypothetical protein
MLALLIYGMKDSICKKGNKRVRTSSELPNYIFSYRDSATPGKRWATKAEFYSGYRMSQEAKAVGSKASGNHNATDRAIAQLKRVLT